MRLACHDAQVPKPLKFLHPHFDALKNFYDKVPTSDETKRDFADLLSVMAMTMAHGKTESLRFKLDGNATQLDEWGHEYIRNLAGEIGGESLHALSISVSSALLT